LKSGEDNYEIKDSRGRNRWGDYNGAALDPQNGRVWIYSEYVYCGFFCDLGIENAVWGTHIGKVAP
jgi:hypothetical protein